MEHPTAGRGAAALRRTAPPARAGSAFSRHAFPDDLLALAVQRAADGHRTYGQQNLREEARDG
jgi:hypothetical protein